MTPDADAILTRMRADSESDWHHRLLRSMYRLRRPERDDLSKGELRVLLCLSHGMGAKETAALCGVATETVKSQSAMLRRKLRAKNTTHAVGIALRMGIIS